MYKCFFSIFLLLMLSQCFGQLTGKITDTQGMPLAYASIYVEGTSVGTTSNFDGDYSFELDKGNYSIVFQYVGYKKELRNISIDDSDLELNIELKEESEQIKEVVISADAEDPAYAVIRKAIEKRTYFKDLIDSYQCDVYTKGNQKVLKMPERILGQEVGDFDGSLDSNRQGIVYLSEAISKYYYRAPNDFKEVMISSKVSGNDQGYSFNSASAMSFSFYANTLDMNRAIVSPIANNALRYYDYKLIGTKYESDYLINKIQVIPKRNNDPVFAGVIYIVEDLWNIHSLDLNVTGKACNLYFIDTLNFKQVSVPIAEPDKWVLLSNVIGFSFAALGAELEGLFTCNYSNYVLNPSLEKDFFGNEVIKIEKESNKKEDSYWDVVRPVPLTSEEQLDYKRKDSIQAVRKDPAYLDSIDRKENKFEILDLLTGYRYQRSSKNQTFSISSPLGDLGYNTVQGYTLGSSINFRQEYGEHQTARLRVDGKIGYGFAEEKLRASGSIDYLFNKINYTRLSLSGGSYIHQYNREEPVSRTLNGIYSLLFRRNFAKYYDVKKIRLLASSNIMNGVRAYLSFEHGKRSGLINNSNTSYFYKDSRIFTANDPLDPAATGIALFDKNIYSKVDLQFRIRFKQKYISYPYQKFLSSSRYPTLNIGVEQAFGLFNGEDKYTKLYASVRDNIAFGANGYLEFYLNGGKFLGVEQMNFAAYRHINGNQIIFSNPEDYLRSFHLLPYYSHSTNDAYGQVHLQYHFEGAILDKIPGIRNLGFQLVAGAKYLKSGQQSAYKEFHVGLDNIGIHLFRLFRVDAVWSFQDGFSSSDFGVRIGVKL